MMRDDSSSERITANSTWPLADEPNTISSPPTMLHEISLGRGISCKASCLNNGSLLPYRSLEATVLAEEVRTAANMEHSQFSLFALYPHPPPSPLPFFSSSFNVCSIFILFRVY